jgi:hypothetical protein
MTDSLLDGEEQDVGATAVTARTPDGDAPAEERARWLGLQERLETRAELADAGLFESRGGPASRVDPITASTRRT